MGKITQMTLKHQIKSVSRMKVITPITPKMQIPDELQEKSVKSGNPWQSVILTMGKMGFAI
jgi:hypothetical protein